MGYTGTIIFPGYTHTYTYISRGKNEKCINILDGNLEETAFEVYA
jgi:hypothetical protein